MDNEQIGSGITDQRRIDAVRRGSSEVENELIDAYSAGSISRREFVRRGTVIGMSIPVLGFLASACGGDDAGAGGTLKTGIETPAAALDPVKVGDEGGLQVLSQSGEFLSWSNKDLELEPRLAESWKPNEDGSVWRFKIRQGVKFHDGSPMAAEDVAASLNRLADPANGSNALSVFGGVLSPGGAKAVDPTTVEFTLDAPNGNFPYLVSSDNYNAIILPKDFDGKWEKTFVGTGPWRLNKYTPNVGVTYAKYRRYWDKTRRPTVDRSELKFYPKEQAAVLALQSGEIDVLSHYSVSGGKAVLNDPNLKTLSLRSSVHRELHMRTDKEPFTDKRVRQAVALAIDRKGLVDGLFQGKADLGNDSPFAPVYQSTEPLPQREQDLAKAKELLAAAGQSGGFSVELNTYDGLELPDLAQLVQNDLAKIGVRVKLNITDVSTYYGDAVFGKSPWLDSVMGITDYNHRGVPNVFLGAPLTSKGSWNAAHFKNKTYDQLVAEYAAALDLDSQRTAARKIQELLLDEVPIVYPYFTHFLTGTKSNVKGVVANATGHVDLAKAGLTA